MTEYGLTMLWLLVGVIAVGTYTFRTVVLLLFVRVSELPDAVETFLRFVPAAILAALAVSGILPSDGGPLTPDAAARVLAGGVGGVVAYRTHSMIATIIAGMSVLWIVQFVFLP